MNTPDPRVASRIVFLVNGRAYGGAEQHSLNLASELRRRGLSVLIVAPPNHSIHRRATDRAIETRSAQLGLSEGRWHGTAGMLAFINPLSRRRSLRVIAMLAREQPTIFMCPHPREQILAAWVRQPGVVSSIWVVHSPFRYVLHKFILRPVWHRAASQTQAIVTVSARLASTLQLKGRSLDKLRVIPNAVPEATTREPSVRREPDVIGTATRLVRAKGIQYLIEAMPEILARRSSARLDIAGSGRYERVLRWHVRRLRLGDHVRFLGQVSDVVGYLSSLSVFVHPSVDPGEVVPTVILEAASAGTPVIASSIAGIPDQVIHGSTGILVEPGDSAALAGAVVEFLEKPELARKMGRAGQQLVRKEYSLIHMGEGFLQVIREIEQSNLSVLQPVD